MIASLLLKNETIKHVNLSGRLESINQWECRQDRHSYGTAWDEFRILDYSRLDF